MLVHFDGLKIRFISGIGRLVGLCFLVILFGRASAWASDSNKDTALLKKQYSTYQKALTSGNTALAKSTALTVWETSERTLGDVKQTGDFAFNYASIGRFSPNSKGDKKIRKAYERSIELAALHGDKSNEVTIKRLIEYAKYQVQINRNSKAQKLVQKAEAIAQTSNIKGTELFGDLMQEKAIISYKNKDYKSALNASQAAMDTYKSLDLENTKTGYIALYYLSLAQMKNKQYKKAGRGFEKIYLNTEQILPPKSPYIGRAFIRHGQAFSAYRTANNLKHHEARDYSVCEICWPNFNPKYAHYGRGDQYYAFKRVAPQIPRNASSSAFVVLLYDTDEQGKPTNVRQLQKSHAITFDASTNIAMASWRVALRPKNGDKSTNPKPAANVKDQVAKFIYMLTDRKGRTLDFYGRPFD